MSASSQASLVQVYVVSDRIILRAMTPLDVAAWTSTDVLAVMDEDDTDDSLGAALVDMMAESLVAPQTVDNASAKALLKAAKVRSYTALVRTAKYISVNREGDGPVLMLPAAPGRRGGGWITVPHEEGIVVEDPSPNALGAALRRAIEQSTTTPVDD